MLVGVRLDRISQSLELAEVVEVLPDEAPVEEERDRDVVVTDELEDRGVLLHPVVDRDEHDGVERRHPADEGNGTLVTRQRADRDAARGVRMPRLGPAGSWGPERRWSGGRWWSTPSWSDACWSEPSSRSTSRPRARCGQVRRFIRAGDDHQPDREHDGDEEKVPTGPGHRMRKARDQPTGRCASWAETTLRRLAP